MISALGLQDPPILVVAAAGNSGSDNTQIPILPASYRGSVRGKPPLDNLIAVMATDYSDNKCEFSNYGANVDLAAPGKDVFSTSIYFVSPPLPPPNGVYSPAYRLYSGTSAAAAHVSAAAGLLLAIDDWTRSKSVTSSSPRAIRSPICRAPVATGLGSTCGAPYAARSRSRSPPLA